MTPQEQEKYNILLKEGIELARKLGDIESENALRNQQSLKVIENLVSGLRESYNNISSDISYIAVSYRKILQDITKKNSGLSVTTSAFTKLADLARDISISQKDIGNLTQKQIESYKKQFQTQKKNLEIGHALLITNEKYSEVTDVIGAELDKNNTLQKDIIASLKYQSELIKDVDKNLGIAGATATGVKTILNTLGFGGLNQILKIDDALENAKDKAYELSKTKLEADISNFKTGLDNLKNSKKELEEKIKIEFDSENINNKFNVLIEDLNKELSSLFKKEALSYEKGLPTDATKEYESKIQEIISKIEQAENDQKKRRNIKEKDLNRINRLIKEENEKIEEATELANSSPFLKQSKILGGLLNDLGKGFTKAIKDPSIIIGALIATLITQLGKIDKELVSIQKNFSLSKSEANEIRQELFKQTIHAEELFITTSNLVEALTRTNDLLGIQGVISTSNLLTQARLVELVGVQGENAARLQYFSEAQGESLDKNYITQLKTTHSVSQQYGVHINQRKVLDEVGKQSTYLLTQFKGSVQALTEAVATSQALGISLQTVSSIARELINFESSIKAELEAELLLGRNLNLERARYYALTNDLTGLMGELNSQIGTYNDFSKMNVIQQQSLARAMGMGVEELSEMLLRQQYLGKNGKIIGNIEDENLKRRVESLAVQDKFNKAVERLQDLLGSIVSNTWVFYGILGTIATVSLIRMAASLAANLATLKLINVEKSKTVLLDKIGLGIQAKKTAATGSQAIAQGWVASMSGPKAMLTGGIAGLIMGAIITAAILSSLKKRDDLLSPGYGKRILSAPEGTYALNDKDTVLAGTNLFPNDMSKQNSTLSTSVNIDFKPIIIILDDIKSLIQGILNKPSTSVIEVDLSTLESLVQGILNKPSTSVEFGPIITVLDNIESIIKDKIDLTKVNKNLEGINKNMILGFKSNILLSPLNLLLTPFKVLDSKINNKEENNSIINILNNIDEKVKNILDKNSIIKSNSLEQKVIPIEPKIYEIKPIINKEEKVLTTKSEIDVSKPQFEINLLPLTKEVNQLRNEMNEVLNKILNKENDVYLDGHKVGKSLSLSTSKIG